jgi:hypothetical protein
MSPSPAPLEEKSWGRVRIAPASSLCCGGGGWRRVIERLNAANLAAATAAEGVSVDRA